MAILNLGAVAGCNGLLWRHAGLTSKQQEEEVEAAIVEVLRQPVAAHAVAEPGDGRDESARKVRANADTEQLQRHGAAAHHVWRLVIEELQLPY